MAKTKLKAVVAPEIIRLDLGCGPNKREGFLGVDAMQFDGKVDKVLDLRKTPWPWKDGSVEEIHTSHFLEHLAGEERPAVFNEMYRVLREGGKVSIIVPSWSSERAYGDPTHKFPPFCGFSFYYLNKEWRKGNAPHCGYTCDFDFVGGNSLAAPWNAKSPEAQIFPQNHNINVAQDIFVTLTKK
jgi:SAM-dependent methyltransferase